MLDQENRRFEGAFDGAAGAAGNRRLALARDVQRLIVQPDDSADEGQRSVRRCAKDQPGVERARGSHARPDQAAGNFINRCDPSAHEEREERAIALMESLRMIVTQALVPREGGGRIGVREWMKFPDEVREKLMDMSFTKWPNEIQRMLNQYGRSMERSAEIVYEEGKIDRIHYLYLASSTGA